MERPGLVKTSLWLPEGLWKRAKMRAVDERVDLRDVIIAALEVYLKTKKGGDR